MRVEFPMHTVVLPLPTGYHICLPMIKCCVQDVDCLVCCSLDIINSKCVSWKLVIKEIIIRVLIKPKMNFLLKYPRTHYCPTCQSQDIAHACSPRQHDSGKAYHFSIRNFEVQECHTELMLIKLLKYISMKCATYFFSYFSFSTKTTIKIQHWFQSLWWYWATLV